MTPPSASTAHARSTGHARRAVVARGPRRVSGGAGGARAATARPRVSGGAAALPTPLVHRLGAIAESRSLDRLLRSRGWIALLGVLLIGLVFMQVSLLKLNSGMGTDVEKAAALERGNAMLQAEVSKLESNDRIQELAIRANMVLPTSDNVRYLGANGKRIGGSAAAGIPSQGEASTALVPTIPGAATTDGATPATTTTESQTTSSIPDATQAQSDALAAQQVPTTTGATTATTATDTTQATSTTTGATGATSTPTGATAPPPATATTAAATGAATVGGVNPGG